VEEPSILQNVTNSINTFKRRNFDGNYRQAEPEMSFQQEDNENQVPPAHHHQLLMKNYQKESG
jgi:hypothetical protein